MICSRRCPAASSLYCPVHSRRSPAVACSSRADARPRRRAAARVDVAFDVGAVVEVDVDVAGQLAALGAHRRGHRRQARRARAAPAVPAGPSPLRPARTVASRTRSCGCFTQPGRAERQPHAQRRATPRSARRPARPARPCRRPPAPGRRPRARERGIDVVARQRSRIQLESGPRLAAQPFVHGAARARHARRRGLHRRPQRVQPRRRRGDDADADRGAHAGRHHVDARAHRRRPGVGPARDARLPVQAVDQLGGGHRPALGPDEAQHALDAGGAPSSSTSARCSTRGHSERGLSRIVVSAIDSGAGSVAVSARPILPNTASTPGCLAMSAVLRRQLERGVVVAEARRGGRHVEEVALVEARQELAAQTRDDRQARQRRQAGGDQRERRARRARSERTAGTRAPACASAGCRARGTMRPRSRRSRSAGATVSVTTAASRMTSVLVSASGRSKRPGLAAEREHRDERQRRDHQRRQDRRREGARRRHQPAPAPQAHARGSAAGIRLQPPVARLQRHQLGVDRHPQRDGDAAQAHDRGGNAEQAASPRTSAARPAAASPAAPARCGRGAGTSAPPAPRPPPPRRPRAAASSRPAPPAPNGRRSRPASPSAGIPLRSRSMTCLTRAMTAVGSAPRFAITMPTTIGHHAVDVGGAARHRGLDADARQLAEHRVVLEIVRRGRPGQSVEPRAQRGRDVRKRGARGAQLGVGGLDDHLFALAAQRRHLGDARDPDQRGAQHLVLELAQRADLRARPAMFGLAHRHRLLPLRRTQRVLQHPARRRRLGADLDVNGGRQPRPERIDTADDLGAPRGQRRLRR